MNYIVKIVSPKVVGVESAGVGVVSNSVEILSCRSIVLISDMLHCQPASATMQVVYNIS